MLDGFYKVKFVRYTMILAHASPSLTQNQSLSRVSSALPSILRSFKRSEIELLSDTINDLSKWLTTIAIQCKVYIPSRLCLVIQFVKET